MHPSLLWFTAPILFLISHVALADYVYAIDDQNNAINYGPGWHAYPQEIGIQGVDDGIVNNQSYHIAFGSPSVLSMTVIGVDITFYIINYSGPHINAHGSALVNLSNGDLSRQNSFTIPALSKGCQPQEVCVEYNTVLFQWDLFPDSNLLTVEVPQYTLFDYVSVSPWWVPSSDTPSSGAPPSDTPPRPKNKYAWLALLVLGWLPAVVGHFLNS